MARKRKSHKRKSHRRRHRMGAVGSAGFGTIAGIVAGAVAGRWVAKSSMVPIENEKIKNAAVLALGAFLPKWWKGEMGKAVANGMIAAGGVGLVGSFVPALAGTDDTIEFPVTVGEIPDNLSVIAGGDSVMAGDDLQVLAGMDEEEY